MCTSAAFCVLPGIRAGSVWENSPSRSSGSGSPAALKTTGGSTQRDRLAIAQAGVAVQVVGGERAAAPAGMNLIVIRQAAEGIEANQPSRATCRFAVLPQREVSSKRTPSNPRLLPPRLRTR